MDGERTRFDSAFVVTAAPMIAECGAINCALLARYSQSDTSESSEEGRGDRVVLSADGRAAPLGLV